MLIYTNNIDFTFYLFYMNGFIKIRRATLADIDQMMIFESRNRQWFELFFSKQALDRIDEAYFRRQLNTDSGNTEHYLVCLEGTKIIGRFCAQYLDDEKTCVEISYRFDQTYTNKGIARYALRHLLLIFACYGVMEVCANVSSHNQASIRLLTSCGFVHDSTEQKTIKLASGLKDNLVYKWVSHIR